jgi:hypothetical protein
MADDYFASGLGRTEMGLDLVPVERLPDFLQTGSVA